MIILLSYTKASYASSFCLWDGSTSQGQSKFIVFRVMPHPFVNPADFESIKLKIHLYIIRKAFDEA